MYWEWKPYVPVAQRRAKAARAAKTLAKKRGRELKPIAIDGRKIARTFWGEAWCDSLESHSDFENRLPRGRTYVRNGSVIDLKIAAGEIKALVSGSSIYKVSIKVTPVSKPRWKSICKDCAGGIDSLIELLQGRFSNAVMERMCRQKEGLFLSSAIPPSPAMCPAACGDSAGPDLSGQARRRKLVAGREASYFQPQQAGQCRALNQRRPARTIGAPRTMANSPSRKVAMVWLPVKGRLPVVPAVPPAEAPLPVVPDPDVVPAPELPPVVVPEPPPAVVVGVVVGDDDPPSDPGVPEAIGRKGSMPGVAEAAAPVPRRTAAIRAPRTIIRVTTIRAPVIRPRTLSAAIVTILRPMEVKSASFASRVRNGARPGR